MVLATRHGFIQGVLLKFVRCDLHANGLQQHTHGWISDRVECVEAGAVRTCSGTDLCDLNVSVDHVGHMCDAPPNFVVHHPQWRSLQKDTQGKVKSALKSGIRLGFVSSTTFYA